MPEVKQRHSPKRVRHVILIFSTVALVGILALAIWWWHSYQDQQDMSQADATAKSATLLKNQKLYLDALIKANDYLAHARTAYGRRELLMLKGSIYESMTDPKNALAAYRDAEKISLKLDDAVGIARTSQALGDTSTAVTYYRKSANLVSSQDPLYFDEKAQYLSIASKLEQAKR